MGKRLFFILFAILLAGPVLALELAGECAIAFNGSSTLHDFAGTAACAPFLLTVTNTPEEVRLDEVTLTVPVAGMRTGIDRRDRTMREMFDAGHFPQIVGRLAGAPLAELRRRLHAAAETGATFPLLLRIRDRDRTVAARVTKLDDTSAGLNIALEFPVSLAAYGLEPPTVLGFIRVADTVGVKVNVYLAPLPAPWQEEPRQPR